MVLIKQSPGRQHMGAAEGKAVQKCWFRYVYDVTIPASVIKKKKAVLPENIPNM